MLVGVTLVAVLALALVVMNANPVWGYTISPNPPVAGQPFTITDVGTLIAVESGFNCPGHVIGSGSPVTLTLPAGDYSFTDSFCVNFTVVPATGPATVCFACQGRIARDKSFYHNGKLFVP